MKTTEEKKGKMEQEDIEEDGERDGAEDWGDGKKMGRRRKRRTDIGKTEKTNGKIQKDVGEDEWGIWGERSEKTEEGMEENMEKK